MAEYNLEPQSVELIETEYRTIKTKLPVPESLAYFDRLKKSEPRSMMGQPPIIWDNAQGFTVSDKWGNRWIDWSSGVLIANIGHGHQKIIQAIKDTADQPLLASYVFIHEKRIELVEELQRLSPVPEEYQVFLLSTGSEATENCIKLSKTYALETHGSHKKYVLSFKSAFHGRTMGAQLAGGMDHQKSWMVTQDPSFIQIPFPDGFYQRDTSFDFFLNTLKEKNINPEEIAGMITESFQGVGPHFFPKDYAKELEAFCKRYDIVMTFDEIQAGFGRSGKLFCYQHYDVTPDLIACGKGISSSMPLSAVIGKKKIMDQYSPGSMTSTHSGSPICVAATLANLKELVSGNYIENAAKLGEVLEERLHFIQRKYPETCAWVGAKGLVGGMLIVKPGTRIPDSEAALKINVACFHKGLLMFAPVGVGGECIKIAPPLCITEDALAESLLVLEEAVDEVLGK